ncbi:MAG: hypothetical protein A2293_00195 [Elusimicrobia bacterium RIFOXYB2_FULL_49_7]|nr:MAG: hypothetical protein A2293_00195 [Elusimicrobia bacterium RIFOXYB2_FULL_49_7]
MKKPMTLFLICLTVSVAVVFAAPEERLPKLPASALMRSMAAVAEKAATGRSNENYVIRKPGEITFTTGIVIEGRVEKPQVMLILTKERIRLDPVLFRRSFLKDITRSLQYKNFDLSPNAEKSNP